MLLQFIHFKLVIRISSRGSIIHNVTGVVEWYYQAKGSLAGFNGPLTDPGAGFHLDGTWCCLRDE